MPIPNIQNKLNTLSDLSNKMAALLRNDGQGLIDYTNQLSKDQLDKLIEFYSKKIDDAPDGLGSVNRLRNELLKAVRDGKTIDRDVIAEMKEAVVHRFNYKEKVYQAYKDPASILYTFYYHDQKSTVTNILKELSGAVMKELSCAHLREGGITDFNGPQNFGDSKCWFALIHKSYPSLNPKPNGKSKGRSKNPYNYPFQLFFLLKGNHIEYGLNVYSDKKKYGAKRKELARLRRVPVQGFSFDEMMSVFRTYVHVIEADHYKNLQENDFQVQDPPVPISPLPSFSMSTGGATVGIFDHFKHNIILYGPPGTGKTFKTVDIAAAMVSQQSVDLSAVLKERSDEKHRKNLSLYNSRLQNQIFFLTFHQNYSYEEFIGGLRPDVSGHGANTLNFRWTPGIFLKACTAAYNLAFGEALTPEGYLERCQKLITISEEEKKKLKSAPRVILILDEINRANISRVFGELITLIESDKRIGADYQVITQLPNGSSFGVPANLVLVGTMNTADKSIALLDVALRRRFRFYDLYPDAQLACEGQRKFMERLNAAVLEEKKSPDFMVGHSFFMKEEDMRDTLHYEIIPLLYEYFNNKSDAVIRVLAGKNWKGNGNEIKDNIMVDLPDSEVQLNYKQGKWRPVEYDVHHAAPSSQKPAEVTAPKEPHTEQPK